ncbi:zinc finger protein ubi-d4 [Caerostris darwini]|uniref:Zinc finger protein ubi-d4 n=1 Tax=Caerostris darwini TaxID=1538125 RepID=A0AAV4PKX4_9ARAC|nr:zinc finger protein ubi-d4 [Caerostris darwini]
MAEETLSVRTEYLERLKSILGDSFYKDAMEHAASYNTRLCLERKMRLPFLDQQTGVAQSDCALWMHKWQRMPGKTEGQLYSYPARRWKKKRRQYLMNNFYLTRRMKEVENNESENHQSTNENSMSGVQENDNSTDKVAEDSKDSWYKDFEETPEQFDMGVEVEDPDTDVEDYEETYVRKKKKKIRSSRGRKRADRYDYTDLEKPYVCEICGARYKTRPGLSYHYSHGHNNDSTDNTEEETNYTPPKPTVAPPPPNPAPPPCNPPPPPPHAMQPSMSSWPGPSSEDGPLTPRPTSEKGTTLPSTYCDFCLGDSIENKKTRMPEELVSCSDCGRSAHPTCLQFTPNMTASVKKYRWQCIECKSCGICGTSDNDDQLLFCDDCDRGYHMYCLTPPLSEPPEGSWSCHLCIEEYGRK